MEAQQQHTCIIDVKFTFINIQSIFQDICGHPWTESVGHNDVHSVQTSKGIENEADRPVLSRYDMLSDRLLRPTVSAPVRRARAHHHTHITRTRISGTSHARTPHAKAHKQVLAQALTTHAHMHTHAL
eukprot:4920181-Pleurochrysis_carterae.AAC.1